MLITGKKFYQIKVIKIIKNYDQSVEINHNLNCSCIPEHPWRVSIISGSGSGKTNVLLNLIKYQWPDIDDIHLYLSITY